MARLTIDDGRTFKLVRPDGQEVQEVDAPGYERVPASICFPRAAADWGRIDAAVLLDAEGEELCYFYIRQDIQEGDQIEIRVPLMVETD